MSDVVGESFNPYENSLTPEQLDKIVKHIDVDDKSNGLYYAVQDLYVPPAMRNDLSEPGWEHKMISLSKIIQQKFN